MALIEMDSSKIGGTQKWYYEDIPNGKSGVDYRVDCGFKAKKIIIAGGDVGTYQYPHNMAYDEDTSTTQYIQENSSYAHGTFNFGGGSSEGPILVSIDNTGFTVNSPSTNTNRHCYLLALG